MPRVDLSTREYKGQVVVALRGELDIADAANVAAALTEIVARRPQIIIDLAGLNFIDSSGVAALARGRKLARLVGGELRLAAPQPRVRRMLTLSRLIDVLPVHASVDEAAGHAPRRRAGSRVPCPRRRDMNPARTPGSRLCPCSAVTRAMTRQARPGRAQLRDSKASAAARQAPPRCRIRPRAGSHTGPA